MLLTFISKVGANTFGFNEHHSRRWKWYPHLDTVSHLWLLPMEFLNRSCHFLVHNYLIKIRIFNFITWWKEWSKKHTRYLYIGPIINVCKVADLSGGLVSTCITAACNIDMLICWYVDMLVPKLGHLKNMQAMKRHYRSSCMQPLFNSARQLLHDYHLFSIETQSSTLIVGAREQQRMMRFELSRFANLGWTKVLSSLSEDTFIIQHFFLALSHSLTHWFMVSQYNYTPSSVLPLWSNSHWKTICTRLWKGYLKFYAGGGKKVSARIDIGGGLCAWHILLESLQCLKHRQ